MSTPIPIIQGRVGQLEGASGFVFEIFVTIGPTEPVTFLFDKPTFLNEKAAHAALRVKAVEVSKTVCKALGLPEPTGFHDLKRNLLVTQEELEKYE